MRRILIALVMSGAVVVAAPTASMAQRHHSRHHHARHHARHRSTRHRRRERFGHWDENGSAQPAGTVTMFTDNGDGTGVLTITLNDGSMVTGNVTKDTELECTTSNSGQQGDDNGDNDGNGDNNANGGDDNANGGDNNASDDDGGNGDDNGGNGDGDNGAQMCSTASLTPGASVADAVLEISSSGAVWKKVELITS